MSREELEKMKADDIAKICKQKGIQFYNGKTRLRKGEMIEKIIEQEDAEDESQRWWNEEEEEATEGKKETNAESIKGYLDRLQVGQLVAFQETQEKVNTAMVKKIHPSRKKVKLETQYGAEFIVSADDILWVKTGARWPNFVFKMLKRRKNNAGEIVKQSAG